MLPETLRLHELIDVVITILDARDPYTMEHSYRVAEYAEMIADHMDLDLETHQKVHVAAHFHDIGKIGVEDSVLSKPGKLTDNEKLAIQTHTRFGYNILKRLPSLEEISEIVLYHHERYDGLGYPEGLAGRQIPLESRIIAVADAFDAMTSDRFYRNKMPFSSAMEEIVNQSERQFCPRIVKHFRSCMQDASPLKTNERISAKPHFAFDGHEDLMRSKLFKPGTRDLIPFPNTEIVESHNPDLLRERNAKLLADFKTATLEANETLVGLVVAMSDILQVISDASNIIETIDSIAFKTRLISFNAAIEAANAGEAGNSFSVIAQEVKALAEQVSSAASDTAGLLNKTVRKVNEGEKLTTDAINRFDRVISHVLNFETEMEKTNSPREEQLLLEDDPIAAYN